MYCIQRYINKFEPIETTNCMIVVNNKNGVYKLRTSNQQSIKVPDSNTIEGKQASNCLLLIRNVNNQRSKDKLLQYSNYILQRNNKIFSIKQT